MKRGKPNSRRDKVLQRFSGRTVNVNHKGFPQGTGYQSKDAVSESDRFPRLEPQLVTVKEYIPGINFELYPIINSMAGGDNELLTKEIDMAYAKGFLLEDINKAMIEGVHRWFSPSKELR